MTRPLTLDLPNRPPKPRETGLTCVVDNGVGLNAVHDALGPNRDRVDLVKLGWGTAYVTTDLAAKVRLLQDLGIGICFGGLMFELAYWQGKWRDYAAWLEDLGVQLVEVSNGSLPIPDTEKVKMVDAFSARGFMVLSEVGNKDITKTSPPEDWVRAIQDDMAAGAWKVIIEGRADASAGIYNADGSVQVDILDTILDSNIPADSLIFEAPHKRQMSWFIHQVGTNVNLGNVPYAEVLNLETLRLGLRGDTVQHIHGASRATGAIA